MKTLNKNEEAFIADITAVMEKHGVSLRDSDEYDGEENYRGTTYQFSSRTAPQTIYLPLRELASLLP